MFFFFCKVQKKETYGNAVCSVLYEMLPWVYEMRYALPPDYIVDVLCLLFGNFAKGDSLSGVGYIITE